MSLDQDAERRRQASLRGFWTARVAKSGVERATPAGSWVGARYTGVRKTRPLGRHVEKAARPIGRNGTPRRQEEARKLRMVWTSDEQGHASRVLRRLQSRIRRACIERRPIRVPLWPGRRRVRPPDSSWASSEGRNSLAHCEGMVLREYSISVPPLSRSKVTARFASHPIRQERRAPWIAVASRAWLS